MKRNGGPRVRDLLLLTSAVIILLTSFCAGILADQLTSRACSERDWFTNELLP